MSDVVAVGNLYRTKRGDIARVEYVGEKYVRLIKLSKDGTRTRGGFVLPLWFFISEKCGWKIADAEPLQVVS